MWVISLLETITGFIPRPAIIRDDEAGFRQVPKPWKGWPWDYWPWIRWTWIKKPWAMKPWHPRVKHENTWLTETKAGGWYWIIPWIMEYETCKTKTQVKDIRAQSVWTKDGHDVTVGTSIRYYVKNAMKALLEVHDYDQSLQNVVLGVVCDYVRQHTLDELKSSLDELKNKLLESVRNASDGWGLKIQDVAITDIGKTQNFRILLSGDLLSTQ